MDQKNLVRALSIAIQTPTREGLGVPVLIEGPPGVGKTSIIEQLGRQLGWHVEVVVGSFRDPADVGGWPIHTPDGIKLDPPGFVKRILKAAEAGQPSLLFIDELTGATPMVQSALLRVIRERWVGDIKLPYNVAVVAAYNPPHMAAGGWDLAHATLNRFCHMQWKADQDAWEQAFRSDFKRPLDIVNAHVGDEKSMGEWLQRFEEQYAMVRAQVAGFLRYKPDAFYQEPKAGVKAWPTPRTWEMAARLYATVRALYGENTSINEILSDEALDILFSGCVGQLSYEFFTWLRHAELIDPEKVLENPEKAEVPKRGDLQYTLLMSVVSAVARKPTEDRWHRAWTFLGKFAEGAQDLAVIAAKDLLDIKGKKNWKIPKELLQMSDFISRMYTLAS